MNTRKGIIFILALFFLSACQTTGIGTDTASTPTSSHQVAKNDYSLFYDQKDHLKELVAAGNFSDASTLYEEQRAFFDEKLADDPDLAAMLDKVVEDQSRSQEPEIAKSRKDLAAHPWPAPVSDWDSARIWYRHSLKILSIIPKDGVFVNPAYRPAGLAELQAESDAYKAKIAASFDTDFQSFDHFGDKAFFGLHPALIGPEKYFDDHPDVLETLLGGRSAEEIAKFGATYKDRLGSTRHWQTISNAYVDARLRNVRGKGRSLADILDIVNQAKSAGFDVKKLDQTTIGFVEVTSRTLLKEGQIDFPAAVDVDLPFATSQAELDDAFTPQTLGQSDYLIVFDVALAKASRKVSKMTKQPSTLVVGYEKSPNPEHTRLQNSMNMAQMETQNANMNLAMQQNQYCQGLGCIVVAIAASQARDARDQAQAELQSIMSQLNSTPSMIDVPIKRPYSYEVGQVDASKSMTVHYYVIDKVRKRYFKDTFDVVENKRFGVAYNIEQSDPDAKANFAKHDSEKDVSDWEKQASTIKLSQLVEHYLANQSKAKPLPSINALRTEMLNDRNKALASYKENTFEASTANDPRFDSVVVVLTTRGLGSGFFVRPDVVMTNYHVVEEFEFVELKMHDGQETFGKVIARDAGLDLALIRVQARGKPVRFYTKNKIELGSTVEVIGHPRRLEFSITRGIVSAVRKMKSPNLSGGPDVLHVQVDAATSPGNSGGPVFMDDTVVSVVSWGNNQVGSENLNFTVHYSEALRFIREALGGNS